MTNYLFADLIAEGLPLVRFWGKQPPSAEDRSGYWIGADGIKDWYSTPSVKTELTEMQTGDGAHGVYRDSILYSARTVTLNWVIDDDDRDQVLSLLDVLSMYAHEQVVLRVVDAEHDTYAQGFVSGEVEATWYDTDLLGSITVQCDDPYRYGAYEHAIQLGVASSAGGGLVYDNQKALHYPLSYGAAAPAMSSFGTLVNYGSTTAFPRFEVHGPFPYGVRLDTRFGVLAFVSPIPSPAVPLILDCRTRTASLGGADVTRRVLQRAWPRIAKGGSLGVSLQTMDGTGWVDGTVRDTYI